ncbi:MAG: plasmid pRiA4b ORF-3 family protein, partial [Syntrophomonadaceae bacterium]|nr:plasmid pRiA4b ORF-3 family protein [Syntrophomonadaceae bacterium]
MLIHCTKKLLDELKIAPSVTPDDFDPLFSWRAHIITVNRRKTVVLMCDLNRYVVVLYGLKAKDFKELNQRIVAAIRNTLLKEQVNSDVAELYLAQAGEVVFVRNADRSQTARLNKACDNVCFALRDIDDDYNDTAGVLASYLLVGGTEKEFFHPNEKMIEDLQRFGIEPVLKCRAFELNATLSLLPHDAKRKIIVPLDITFLELHKVLQAAFGWKDYHLFDFLLFEHEGQEEASVELVVSEEDLEYRHGNARLMKGVALSEYLPKYKYLLYHYDFGDNWSHYIEVTAV